MHYRAIETNLGHFHRVKISFLWNIWLFGKPYFTLIQKCRYFRNFCLFSNFSPLKSNKGGFLTKKFTLKFKLNPPQSRIRHFLFFQTIMAIKYWHIWIIWRFFENTSLGENDDFGLSIWFHRIFEFEGVWLTSRLFTKPFWSIFELLDPAILRS